MRSNQWLDRTAGKRCLPVRFGLRPSPAARTIELALRPDETLLVGSWVLKGKSVVGDSICERIETLLATVLVHVADDPKSGAWESLFRDPSDGRFWERFYPQGEMHGGGPPSLRCLSAADAAVKYSLASSPR